MPSRTITITSTNFVPMTLLMLESFRAWHPDPNQYPVTVYALEQGWEPALEADLRRYAGSVEVLTEENTEHRKAGVHCAFKLDAFLKQADKFLYLDSDVLVLGPLDAAWEIIGKTGWLSVTDHLTVEHYLEPHLRDLVEPKPEWAVLRSFNAGIMGADYSTKPVTRSIIETAHQWAGVAGKVTYGDQALLNLAWLKLTGGLPVHAGYRFNSGILDDGRFELGNQILHFCGGNYRRIHEDRLSAMGTVWKAWPRISGNAPAPLRNIEHTPWWTNSLPHPWPWLNQCGQRQYRHKLRQMRAASLELLENRQFEWLILPTADHATLLDTQVLNAIEAFWSEHASTLSNCPHRPTANLRPQGQFVRLPRLGRLLADVRRAVPGLG